MMYARTIIDKTGGYRALARALGKPISTVKSWYEAGSIPDKHKREVLAVTQAMGLGFERADFFPETEE